MFKKKYWYFIIIYSVILLLTLVDIIVKIVVAKTMVEGEPKTFIKGFMEFVYIKNTGAVFGSFSGASIFLIVVSFIMIGAFIFIDIITKHKNWWYYIGFSLVMAGALGNLIDRLIMGFGDVIDYINFTFVDFAVFNLADTFLTVGMICYVVYFIFFGVRKNTNGKVDNK